MSFYPCLSVFIRGFESSDLLHPSLLFQPKRQIRRPRMPLARIPFAAAETHSVSAFLVNVKIKRNTRFFQRLGKLQAVLDGHCLVFVGAPNKTRRSFLSHMQLIRKLAHQLWRWVGSQ